MAESGEDLSILCSSSVRIRAMTELRPPVEVVKVSLACVDTSQANFVPELCFQFRKGRFAPF